MLGQPDLGRPFPHTIGVTQQPGGCNGKRGKRRGNSAPRGDWASTKEISPTLKHTERGESEREKM